MKKLTILALVLVACLGTLGIGYARWTDEVVIKGRVETGSIDINVCGFSGTWVYKNLDTHELVYSYAGPISDGNLELVAKAWAERCDDGCGDDCVLMTWQNIFPTCFDIEADAVFCYEGTIPGVVDEICCDVEPGSEWILPYVTVEAWTLPLPGEPVDIGYQLHDGDRVMLVVKIQLPQDNDLMGKTACATCTIKIAQWAECPAPC